MSYTKIVQYGDKIELYEYEKSIIDNPRKPQSRLSKKRQKERAKKRVRTSYSINRSKRNFFRLVHHNNYNADTVTFATFTFNEDYTYSQVLRFFSHFYEKLKKEYPEPPISYISVPEVTKKGRYHLHVLFYDLPARVSVRERKTRNLQRLFKRGYVDLRPATKITAGIAGYLSKYMAKSLQDEKNECKRGYNSSRNIKKVRSAGSNAMSGYTDMIIGNSVPFKNADYEVPFLGRCRMTLYLNISD